MQDRLKAPRAGAIAMFVWIVAMALSLSTAAMAQSGYAIQTGDTLNIEVLEDPSLDRNVLVLPDGRISFPLIGTITAAGRSVDSLRNALVAALTPDFASPPTVFVSVGRIAEQRETPAPAPEVTTVFAIGEVSRPGEIEGEPGLTILQALAPCRAASLASPQANGSNCAAPTRTLARNIHTCSTTSAVASPALPRCRMAT